jgi:hypothetical protein
LICDPATPILLRRIVLFFPGQARLNGSEYFQVAFSVLAICGLANFR